MGKLFKTVAAGALSCLALACLGGCSLASTFDVRTASDCVIVEGHAQFTDVELAAANALYPDADLLALMQESDAVTLTQTEEILTTTYDASTKPQVISGSDLTAGGVVLTGDKFVFMQDASQLAQAGLAGGTGTTAGDIMANPAFSTLAGAADYSLVGTFDKKPVKANGLISGYTVDYSYLREPFVYAVFTNKAATSKKVTASVANKKATNSQTVSFDSPSVINKIVLNGAEQPLVSQNADGTKRFYTVTFPSQGAQSVTVSLISGGNKTFTYTYDTAKPKANVKANKTYRLGKVLKVTDKASGLASVKLDGKKVKLAGGACKVALKKKGAHRLIATDKAGNKLIVKFKVKKK